MNIRCARVSQKKNSYTQPLLQRKGRWFAALFFPSSTVIAGGPSQHAALQLAVLARELSDEVLFLPRPLLASTLVCGRGRDGNDSGLRAG